jgi:hypothetical protein
MTEDSATVVQDNQPSAEASPATPVQNYTDGYSYEVPRPFLTLNQAAGVLGMTLRSLERSLLGRWGNKLPDGWLARKMKTMAGDEWRILPPPGFRVKLAPGTTFDTNPDEHNMDDQQSQGQTTQQAANFPPPPAAEQGNQLSNKRKQPWRPERHTIDQPTIIIDRSEEIEHLLKELVAAKGALAEERRLHLEDLRVISQLQGSLRLLEVNSAEQARVKTELETAKSELTQWKEKYNELISKPWWRKLFGH